MHNNISQIFMDAFSYPQTKLTHKLLLGRTVEGGMRGVEYKKGVAKGGRGQIG
jgi:hypothetical protein